MLLRVPSIIIISLVAGVILIIGVIVLLALAGKFTKEKLDAPQETNKKEMD